MCERELAFKTRRRVFCVTLRLISYTYINRVVPYPPVVVGARYKADNEDISEAQLIVSLHRS